MSAAERRAGDRFATTHWSVVLAAGGSSTGPAQQALTTLYETYWYPLYAYLRRQGHSAEDAQDLSQGFFAHLLEKRSLRSVDPQRGRFRSFLLASLKHFVANERDRARAQKRGGTRPPIPLEFETAEGRYALEPRDDTTPEKLFDRRWALVLLDRVLGRLRAEFRTREEAEAFDRVKIFLTGEKAQVSYRETGVELGMSEGAVKVKVHRLRRRFRELLHDEIAQTVTTPEEAEDELRYLLTAVGS